MLAAIRRDKIKKILLETGSITITEMAQKFDVSQETIRRDIKILHNEGILKKTFGGAILRSRVNPPIHHEVLENIFVECKKLIAEICKEFILNNDSIFLDHSTTALQISYLLEDLNITVLTNSLPILNVLKDKKNIKLISIGGNYNLAESGFFGRVAIGELINFHVDKAFVSCTSLNIEEGICDKTEEVSDLRRTVIENSNEVYLVADHTKFNKIAFTKTIGFEKIDYVVADFKPSHEWISFFNKNKIILRYPTMTETNP